MARLTPKRSRSSGERDADIRRRRLLGFLLKWAFRCLRREAEVGFFPGIFKCGLSFF